MRPVKTSVDEGTVGLCPPQVKNNKLAEKLFSRVRLTPTGCWEWTGPTTGSGYGYFDFKGVRYSVHRTALAVTAGPIAPGLCACHHCDNKKCANPAHLFAATQLDNMRDAIAKGRIVPQGRNAKLTADEVRYIREQRRKGVHLSVLALAFGVTPSTVRRAQLGINWKWLA